MPMTLPADVYNRALDMLGADTVIGDASDGTPASEWLRRNYGRILRELLRAAHWNFARKYAALLLLADASGQTLDPGTSEQISTAVEPPWIYCYAWPSDGVAGRWLPWDLGPLPTTVPLMTNMPQTQVMANQCPARFLISSSDQFPAMVGQVGWDELPNLPEGQGPISRRVVLTNVPNAKFVYTKLTLAIEEWDPLFEQAMVACLGSRSAMTVLTDKKRAMVERAALIGIAKDALMEARAKNANDAGFPQSLDHVPDWIRARRSGPGWNAQGPWGDGAFGVLGCGWEPMAMADGSVF